MSLQMNNNLIKTIFILGYPRSGTTWFSNLFNAHPDIVYRHEMIGRCYNYFPISLFNKLKFNHSLCEEDYNQAIKIILSPNIESDRPPFFKKRHLFINTPKLHYFSWIATRSIMLFSVLYRILFSPKGYKFNLVIKETRSTVNLNSILEGLRPNINIILFRHPCGAIASALSGIASGKMIASTSDKKESWFELNKDRGYLKQLSLTIPQIRSLPEHEYLALLWRFQNEEYMKLSIDKCENIFINYENFIANQERNIESLFSKLDINVHINIKDFLHKSSGKEKNLSFIKDSSSSYYSVFRDKQFDPNKWKQTLSAEQISGIEKHTLNIFNMLKDVSTH